MSRQYFNPPQPIRPSDMQLGDLVRMKINANTPWGTCIVKNVDKDSVHLFRPYGTHEDFSCTSGVICYVGIEQYAIARSDTFLHVWEIMERPDKLD